MSVRDLSIWYGSDKQRVSAVEAVTFKVATGQIVGLIGASGCGKSTLAMSLLRLRQAPQTTVAGQALWNGRSLFAMPLEEMIQLRGRELALIPQNAMSALNPVYTVEHQVAEVTRLQVAGAIATHQARELLTLVGLPASHHTAYPHELSGGMRQRVVVAMAVANRPQLLIADEPTTGLDTVTQVQILQLLLTIRRRFNMAMLLISHDLPLIGRVADYLLVMQAGQIVERGEAQQLLTHPHHPHTQALMAAMSLPSRPTAVDQEMVA